MPTIRKPDVEATKLFGAGDKAVHIITGEEIRQMVCDPCSNAAGWSAKTNHRLNDQLQWVCCICGHNPLQACLDDDNTLTLLASTARLLGQMDPTRRKHFSEILVDCLANSCGDETLQDIVNCIGRRDF